MNLPPFRIEFGLICLVFLHIKITYAFYAFDGDNNNVKIRKHGLELTQTLNLQRQEILQKTCKTLGYDNHTLDDLTYEQMEHMIVDPKHKFMYCYVPKVACTNWKRVLMLLTDQWTNGTDPLQIPASLAHSPGVFLKMSNLTDDERQTVLSEYTRFVLVRHPFERLLSAYRNKLEGDSASARYFQSRVGKTIVRNFRVDATNKSLENGNDVTFDEFIKYLLNSTDSGNGDGTSKNHTSNNFSFNEHWEPISSLCNPCIMKYNVIGKYETLLDDSALALHLTGDESLTFPTGHKSSGTRSQLKKYFDPIPVGAIRKLYEIYLDDFRLFDYGVDQVLGFEFG